MDRGENYRKSTDFMVRLLHDGEKCGDDKQRQIQGDVQEGAGIFFTIMFIGMMMVEAERIHRHPRPHKQ